MEDRQAGVLSQCEEINLAELREVVAGWLSENCAELDDGGHGDVIALARRIEQLSRKRRFPIPVC